MESGIRIFAGNEKLDEAYSVLLEKFNTIIQQFQLNYYETFGILGTLKADLYRTLDKQEDLKDE